MWGTKIYICRSKLQDAGIKTANSIILTGLLDEGANASEADAIVLSSLLQVIIIKLILVKS